MKTLILYATKNGAAHEIAQRIASQIDDADVHDLKNSIPSLDGYDCIIIGSSVYAGMVRKEAKAFAEKNAATLCDKRLGVFISGLDENKANEYFTANFPSEILQAAKAAYFLGGIFDPKKAGFFGRLIMKAVAKQTEYTDSLDDAKIKQFAKAVVA